MQEKHRPSIAPTAKAECSLLDAAKSFVARGWPVIPLVDKLPLRAWKEFQERLPSEEELEAWFLPSEHSPTGLGVVTGRLSGLVVVDCDSRQDAEFWKGEHGSSPLVVATGGGGVHFYYAMPHECEVRNRQGLLGRKIDLRGEGGYVTAPPSLHPLGTRYEWQAFDGRAVLPRFEVDWLATGEGARRISKTHESQSVRHVVRYIQKIVAVAGEGGHNATFRAACKLCDAGLAEEEALAILGDWNKTNATPPWSAEELAHKIRSAFQRRTK